MTLVVDASVVVAALVDDGPVGRWAEGRLAAGSLVAPHVMPAEVAGVLWRAEAAGELSADTAALAHGDLDDLAVELVAYAPGASRAWELRHELSAYDAWYVTVAEDLDVPLATLDRRLAGAAGPRCTFEQPPAADSA